MSILFSGDFHASIQGELSSITKKSLVKKYEREIYSRVKYQVILGDGAFMCRGVIKLIFLITKLWPIVPFPYCAYWATTNRSTACGGISTCTGPPKYSTD
jgi:hypothetical protein